MLRTPISLMSTVLPPHANSFVIGPAVIKHTLKRSALSNSPQASAPPPSQAFTQCPYPPRSLVRDGQTSPDRPRLVVSRITCPPLSLKPCPETLDKCDVLFFLSLSPLRERERSRLRALFLSFSRSLALSLMSHTKFCCKRC